MSEIDKILEEVFLQISDSQMLINEESLNFIDMAFQGNIIEKQQEFVLGLFMIIEHLQSSEHKNSNISEAKILKSIAQWAEQVMEKESTSFEKDPDRNARKNLLGL